MANQEAAYEAIQSSGISSLYPVNIHATHYYVKFKPANFYQAETLGSDTTLALYDYPLDYAIAQTGNRYHDPSLPDSVPTYQYASVKADYHFIDTIPYEIIESLYIPEEDEQLKGTSEQNLAFVDKLLNQAYRQTGNDADTIDTSIPPAQARFTPGGRIQTFDTRLQNLVGFEGVSVRARRWFTEHEATPDFNGYYRMKHTFINGCNYSLWYATSRFTVNSRFFGLTHWINGPKKKGDWNYDIRDGYDRFMSHIFRGAYRYHFLDNAGLRRPNTTAGNRTLYIGRDWSGGSTAALTNFLSNVFVYRYQNDEGLEYASDEIYSATCHETAHVVHIRQRIIHHNPWAFFTVDNIIRESWAIGVEWVLTGIEYRQVRGIPNYGDETYNVPIIFPNQYAFQYWNNKSFNKDYSNLFIDLIDNFNEIGRPFGFLVDGTVDDQVTGYTISQVEDFTIQNVRTLDDLRRGLKANKPAGVTDQQIDLLLHYYY